MQGGKGQEPDPTESGEGPMGKRARTLVESHSDAWPFQANSLGHSDSERAPD